MPHQQYTTTLKQMVGRVLAIKPNLAPTLAIDFVNDCIRVMLDRRTNWAGMIAEKTVYIPAPISAGTVNFTQNSASITITGAVWPVDDSVNTTSPSAVGRPGLITIVPASMTNITVDTLLYVDSGGQPEIVAVKSVTDTSFQAKFKKAHTAGFTITSSSYSNRQLRTGYQNPIFTIRAVTSPTSAIIDQPWYADNATPGATVVKMYYTIDPSVKSLLSMVDKTMGVPPLAINLPVTYLNRMDPQRSATGYPQIFASKTPDENGNMTYELWPTPQSARQLTCTYSYQPPILVSDDDFLPDFVNPSVIFMYCQAMAWSTKVGIDDPQFDPVLSAKYMAMFDQLFGEAVKADDEKAASGVDWQSGAYAPWNNSQWNQTHSVDALLYY